MVPWVDVQINGGVPIGPMNGINHYDLVSNPIIALIIAGWILR